MNCVASDAAAAADLSAGKVSFPKPCQRCGATTTATGARCERCEGTNRLPRPCLNCSRPTTTGDYCAREPCQELGDRNRRRTHYRGDYTRRAADLRARSRSDPTTRCTICGARARAGDPWTAHHIRPGDPTSPLEPAHKSCNEALGDSVG